MSYKLDAISNYGANKCAIIELDSTNAVVASLVEGSNCINLGHIKDFSSGQTASKTESKSEDGKTRHTESTYDLNYSGTLMQTDKQLMDFLRDTVKGKRYLLYKHHFERASGVDLEEFALVNVTPQGLISTPGADGSNKFEATGVYPDATTAFTSTVLASIETALSITIVCTAVSITASKGYDLIET